MVGVVCTLIASHSLYIRILDQPRACYAAKTQTKLQVASLERLHADYVARP